MTNFSLNLKLARIRRGIKQREIALRADLSPSALSDFENGWRTPTSEQLMRICAAIGISPEDLERAA